MKRTGNCVRYARSKRWKGIVWRETRGAKLAWRLKEGRDSTDVIAALACAAADLRLSAYVCEKVVTEAAAQKAARMRGFWPAKPLYHRACLCHARRPGCFNRRRTTSRRAHGRPAWLFVGREAKYVV